MDEARAALAGLIEERGEDFSSLSRLIGRNAAYVQQYIRRGVPRRLAEEDRRLLAGYFGVSEAVLGGPAPPPSPARMVTVPRLDVGASAGSGALDPSEELRGGIGFDRQWLRKLGLGDGRYLSIIAVAGDSMVPILADGDEILVDRGDGVERLRDGIYVLRVQDALVVKRLALSPMRGRVSVRSDNQAYPSWPDCPLDEVDIVGRVVWAMRQLS